MAIDYEYLFRRENDFYANNKDTWDRNLEAYKGGADYIETALVQHVSETDVEFEERQDRAYYFNYPQKIAKLITQFTLSTPPVREGADSDLVEDWSRSGLRTNEVMRQFSTYLNICGCGWLCVDMPSFDGEPTKEAEIAMRLRPYVLALSPTSVVDWAYGDDGKLLWAIVTETASDAKDPFSAPYSVSRRKLWTRDSVQTFERDSEKSEITIVADVRHDLGVVPLVRHEEVDGYGIDCGHWFEDVVRISDAILNNESEAQMNVVKQMFGMLVISEAFAASAKKAVADDDDDADGDGYKFSHVLARSAALWETAEEKNLTRYISPAGADTATIRSENQNLRKELYNIVGLAVQKDSKMIETAEAKTWDFQNVEQHLKTRADVLEQCEAKAWELMARWSGSVKIPDISYNRNFAVFELHEAIQALLELSSVNIESPEYQREVGKTAVALLNKLRQIPQDSQKAILAEIESASFSVGPVENENSNVDNNSQE